MYLVDKLFGFVNKFLKEKKMGVLDENPGFFSEKKLIDFDKNTDKMSQREKPFEEKLFDDNSLEKTPLILPKKMDFIINSFKLSIIIDDNPKNSIRLNEKAIISRTFELKTLDLNLSLIFKRSVISSDIHIGIAINLLIKSLVFQAEEIIDFFVFFDVEKLGFFCDYSLKENAENKLSVITVKNTINVFYLLINFF